MFFLTFTESILKIPKPVQSEVKVQAIELFSQMSWHQFIPVVFSQELYHMAVG